MLFRNNGGGGGSSSSYQSLSSSAAPPAVMMTNMPSSHNSSGSDGNQNDKDGRLNPVHKGLQFFIVWELVFTILIVLAVVGSESSDGKYLSWAEALYNPQTRFVIPFFTCLAYLVICTILRTMLFSTRKAWWLRLGMILAFICLTLLACFFAAYTVCDPMIRFIKNKDVGQVVYTSPTNTYVSYTHTAPLSPGVIFPNLIQPDEYVLWPLSEISNLGPGWIVDTSAVNGPEFHCSAMTAYTLGGRIMLVLTMPTILMAFMLTTSLPQLFKDVPFHSTRRAIVLYSIAVVLVVGGICVVIINDSLWDWRILVLMSFSAICSSYLSVAVVHLPSPPTTIAFSSSYTPHSPPAAPENARTHLLPTTNPAATTTTTASSFHANNNRAMPTQPIPSVVRAVWLTIQPILAVESFFQMLDDEEDGIFITGSSSGGGMADTAVSSTLGGGEPAVGPDNLFAKHHHDAKLLHV